MMNRVKGRKWLPVVAALVLVPLLALGACAKAPTPVPTEAMPDVIAIGNASLGLSVTATTLGICAALEKQMGRPVRSVPIAAEPSRVRSLLKGDVLLSLTAGAICGNALAGVEEFKDIGPIKVRLGWAGPLTAPALFARADSDIYTMKDLKGKKFPEIKGSPGVMLMYKAWLGYAGYAIEDVKLIPCGSIIAGADLVGTGAADVFYSAINSAKPLEMARTPPGLRVVAFDDPNNFAAPLNPTGVERAKKAGIYYTIWKCPGWGLLEGKDGWMLQSCFQYTVVDTASTDVIYEIVKGIDLAYPNFKDIYPTSSELCTFERTADWTIWDWSGIPLPYHPGTIKYIKEKGLWKTENEQYQQRALAAEKERIAAWKPAK